MHRLCKAMLAMMASAIIVTCGAAGRLVDSLFDGMASRVEQFDAAAWKQADPAGGERLAMVEDLVEHHLRVGMSQEEVVELLGRPGPADVYPCPSAPAVGADETLCYTLSVGRDPYTMLVSLAQGRVLAVAQDHS